MSSADSFLVWGQGTPPVPLLSLRAGPMTACYDVETGFIRRIRLGEREVLRGIYASVRDRNWRTIPAEIRESQRRIGTDDFTLHFEAQHRRDEIDFVWQGKLEGRTDGSLRYEFEGTARTRFLRNRIGFCVLHPIRECAGEAVRVQSRDGSQPVLQFPKLVGPQQPIPGFQDLASLTHQVQPGVWAEVRFTGEAFETEDQRNWIDASFKTYCTPVSLPFPVEILPGTRIQQSITLSLLTEVEPTKRGRRKAEGGTAEPRGSVLLELDRATEFQRLPELGVGLADPALSLSRLDFDRLAALQLSHLRVDLTVGGPDATTTLERAAREATELGLSLELVLHCPTNAVTALQSLRSELTRLRVDLSRVLVLSAGQSSTTPASLGAVRSVLADLGVPLGAGTAADLYELHLQPPPDDADFIAWSVNPQVHASDHASLLETPEAVLDQVRTVGARYPGRDRVISPLTLKPRFNAVATGPENPPPPGELPPAVDPRQMSLFGAAWTVAMLAELLPSGIESLTLFQTVGLVGLMWPAEGPPAPAKFPAERGMVFPLYHVLRAFAGARRCAAVGLDPRDRLAALRWLGDDGSHRMVIANLLPEPRVILCRAADSALTFRQLNETTLRLAVHHPERFWQTPAEPTPGPLELRPFGIAFVTAIPRLVRG